MLKKLTAFFLLCFSCLNAVTTQLIIDTDVDMDDMMAILYLLKRPDIAIKAITTAGDGMSHYKYGVPNLQNLLQLAGHPKIPVSYGVKKSLSPAGEFPAAWRAAVDNVGGIKLPKNPNPPSKLSSADLMIDTLILASGKVSLLCIAPLTNLAIALTKNPAIKDKIERVYIMGGAVHVPGNIVNNLAGYQNKVSEYNLGLDAKAAEMVFESGIPITLVPLDATRFVPITQVFYKKLGKVKRTPSADFVYQIIKPFAASQKGVQEYFWDPLAATLITNPEIGRYKVLSLKVNQVKGPEYGQVYISPQGNPVKVYLSVDPEKFYSLFLNSINRPN